jgi:uncharacterized membrane protein YkoI
MINVSDPSASLRQEKAMDFAPDRRIVALALALLLAGVPARADEEDHDEARRALEEGRVRPLSEIRAHVERAVGGRVVGVELERKDGRYLYELKVVRGGRLREILVDAQTGDIVGEED